LRKLTLIAIAATFAAGSISAGELAPGDIKFEDGAVMASLTGADGNAEEGAKVFMNRKQGNCLACHVNSDMPEQPFHGEVGPPLDGVADRWSPEELRGIVANSKQTFPDTIMPAFFRDAGFTRNLEKFDGKSILSAQQVEDVVAYLLTLKEN
jgi:sulfur-oxidizing protein SoxX